MNEYQFIAAIQPVIETLRAIQLNLADAEYQFTKDDRFAPSWMDDARRLVYSARDILIVAEHKAQ